MQSDTGKKVIYSLCALQLMRRII